MFLQSVEPRSLGGPRNKLCLRPLRIKQKLLRFTKHVESVWLRSMSHHIQESSRIINKKEPTKIFEDNSACVAQLWEGYIKSDRTKHIPSRFFWLEKNKGVDIEYVQSCDNLADFLTKALPTTTFQKHVYGIGMRYLHDLWRES